MLLYYALGGGLGHISRSIAIMSTLPEELQKEFLLMISSDLAHLAAAHIPCAFEVVPKSVMTARGDYHGYLNDCIRRNNTTAIIIDTFPQGLVHELAAVARALPRVLIARYLNIDAYESSKPAGHKDHPHPFAALAIEGLDAAYIAKLKKHADVSAVDSPIIFNASANPKTAAGEYAKNDPEWLVVNSGGAEELASLVSFAKDLMTQSGAKDSAPSILSPEHGIYPANGAIRNFKNVVSATGYNMAALGRVNTGSTHHYLPFKRKYDDQFTRLESIKSGSWLTGCADGAQEAGAWLTDTLKTVL